MGDERRDGRQAASKDGGHLQPVSERVFQIERSGGQWTKGKGCETFGPIGPWFVTKDEVRDPQNLIMWHDVNGEKRQRGNTKTMIFGCEQYQTRCSQPAGRGVNPD
jgi:ureidoglycolate lyase